MLYKLKDFDNQLTNWSSKEDLQFAVNQLKKYGAKENVDFVFKEQDDQCALFVNYKAKQSQEILAK